MKLRSLFVVVFFFAATAAYAQQNDFTIQRDRADIGVGSYTFEKTKKGYKVDSSYHIKVAPRPDTTHLRIGAGMSGRSTGGSVVNAAPDTEDSQQQHSYTLDAGYGYLGGLVKNLNTEIASGCSLNKDHTKLTLSRMRTGKGAVSNEYPFEPAGFVAPNYDASVIQALLYMATTHPTPNGQYFLLVPVADPETGVIQWTAQADTTGTLDGKPVKLHSYSFRFGKHNYTVYADADNTLMEADINRNGVSMIRTGFLLDTAQ